MNAPTLFKIQSVVMMSVCTLIVALTSSRAVAQACTKPGQHQTSVTVNGVTTTGGCVEDPLSRVEQNCADAVTAYGAIARPAGFSEQKLKRYMQCQDGDADLGDDITSDASADARASDSKTCSDYLESSCPELNATSALDAASAYKDAKAAYEEAQKADNEQNQQTQKSINDLTRAGEDAQTRKATLTSSYNSAVLDLTNSKINNDMKLSQGQKDQFLKVSQAIVALESQYTDLDTQLEQARSAVSQAQTGQEAACRAEAESKMTEAKKLVEATAEQRKTLRYNYAMASLAGSANRRLTKDTAKIQIAYVGTYKDCLAGVDAAGAGAVKAIRDAQDAETKKELEIAKKKIDVQKQIDLQRTALANLQQQFAQDGDAAAREAAATLQKMTDRYNQDEAAADKEIARDELDLTQLRTQMQKAAAISLSQVQTAQGEMVTAQSRNNCLKSNYKGSSASNDRFREQMDSAISYNGDRIGACQRVQTSCVGVDEKAAPHQKLATCDGVTGKLSGAAADAGAAQ